MKRKIKLLAFLLAAIWVVSSTPATAEAATPVKLSKSSVTLNITENDKKTTYGTSTIKIKKSKGIKIKKTAYKSANKKIATVSKKGKVTAKKKGSTKITVAVKYKKGKKTYTKKLNYKVKVKTVTEKKTTTETPSSNNIPVKSVTLNKVSLTMKAGESQTLSATVWPANATNKTVSWMTSDKDIATVSNGVIKAVSVGTATITAKAGDKTATCLVTVRNQSGVTKITLDHTELTIKLKEGSRLNVDIDTFSYNDEPPVDTAITWSSSNPSVATVDETGWIQAVAIGNAVITAKAGDKSASCMVTVPTTPYTLGEYSIAGGKSKNIYYRNSNEEICNNIQWKLISGDKKAISGNDSGIDTYEGPWAYVGIKGNIKGDVVVGAYKGEECLGKALIHVTSDNPYFVAYEEWKADMKQKLWKEDMTNKQKVAVFAGYSITLCHYYSIEHDCLFKEDRFKGYRKIAPYEYACSGCGSDCIAASIMIADIADDLGLECKFIDYDGIIVDHASLSNNHCMAYVHFEDGWYEVEATPDNHDK